MLIRELAITNFNHKRYDSNVSPHIHLICSECGKIADVLFPLHVGIHDEHRRGFHIKESEINFYGRCLACIKQLKKEDQ